MAGTSPANEPPQIEPGAGSFRFVDGSSGRRKPLTVWYYRPPRLSTTAPVVFVMHGVKRDADSYRDTWMAAAELFGFLLLCPEFAKVDYPRSAYGLGNLTDGAGEPLPEDEWTFNVIEYLFDFVKASTDNTSERYHIYGHSAGGQFVHRLALFMPQARYETAITANAGWYTMPTFDKKFPYGLKGSAGTPETLKKAFGRRLVILLGERDTDANDPHLRKSSAASRQGANRLERGQAFHATARQEAEDLGTTLNWRLETVPGAAHLQHQMMPAAARALFANDDQHPREESISPAGTAASPTKALPGRAPTRFDWQNIGRAKR